jgi:beta-glucosidase
MNRSEKLVGELTLDEKAALTAGAGMWTTVAIERLGIPAVNVTDGPAGARGPWLPSERDDPSPNIPCGSALGATWDPELLEALGALLGASARAKDCRVLLAPTVNIHRSPLAGRNFECYSEDPLLSGKLAAAFVRGAQSRGVATTVKHFVANEAETERFTMSSVVHSRALREIYLLPFELAVREGGTLGVMTSYNRLNGRWCSEDEALLAGILRGEWGFEGFVLSDWYAATSAVGGATAGLDLERPGPARALGPGIAAAVRAGDLDEALVDAQARRLLTVFDRIGALDDVGTDAGTGGAPPMPDGSDLCRQAAADAMVLLANDGALPLDPAGLRTLAVIGPNAPVAVIMGGGSANLEPQERRAPLDAIRARFADVDVIAERGVNTDKTIPPLDHSQLTTPGGEPGIALEFHDGLDWEGDVVERRVHRSTEIMFVGAPVEGGSEQFSVRARATFVPGESGAYTFSLVQLGRARVLVDGSVVIDGVEHPPPRGEAYFGMGSAEATAAVELREGVPAEIVVEFTSRGGAGMYGVKLGCALPAPADLFERAVAAAASADAAIVVVGTNHEWESEGHDRATMDLPGEQDDLVRRVAAANARTVVVVNTGAPVTMDWADDVAAVLQVWFGGQGMAGALAAVLAGDTEPGGRLPTTIPLRLEHNPSFGNFPGENDEVHYGEGVLVGYRWYEARRLPVRFPFGHGLSYTSFDIGAPVVRGSSVAPGETITVDVPVTNTGTRAGSEVVQCYVAPAMRGGPRLTRPPKELKAFAKVRLEPGETTTVQLTLDERAFAYWDPGAPQRRSLRERTPFGPRTADDFTEVAGWRVDPGRYDLHVGRSSADIAHVAPVDLT